MEHEWIDPVRVITRPLDRKEETGEQVSERRNENSDLRCTLIRRKRSIRPRKLVFLSFSILFPVASGFLQPGVRLKLMSHRATIEEPQIVNGDYGYRRREVLVEQEAKQQKLSSPKGERGPTLDNLREKQKRGEDLIVIDGATNRTDEGDDKEPQVDLTNPVCRVVTLSDGKLPTAESMLPASLYNEPHLLRRLDDIYHAMAHEETRMLTYMNTEPTTSNRDDAEPREYNAHEEKELVSVTRTSLEDAGFELLSRRDLDLCEALNAGYLLRLSILPDVSQLDPDMAKDFYPERFDADGNAIDEEELLFGGRVLVFWRGYSQEVSRGRLFLPKLDYLQASLVQGSAAWVKRKLDIVERWLSIKGVRAYRKAASVSLHSARSLLDRAPKNGITKALRSKLRSTASARTGTNGRSVVGIESGKLFKLARYGGSKIRFVGSPDPTDALTPFVICEREETFCPPCPNARESYLAKLKGASDVECEMYKCLNQDGLKCPYDVVPGETKRGPPVQLLERVSISNLIDFFSSEGRRKLFETLFSKSELVEPTYEKVVVVWRPKPKKPLQRPVIAPPKFVYDLADMFDVGGLPQRPQPKKKPSRSSLEIRTFEGVPMANIPAVLPKTKLVFRPADAFVFDLITLFSLGLIIGSQRFNSTRLDILALVSVSLWVIRTIIRYSNKLARYDLLVKKFLTSKISHRNAGALKYIATEAGSQRATRAALVHSWLTQITSHSDDLLDRSQLLYDGEDRINDLIKDSKKIPVNIGAALNDLEDLHLLKQYDTDKLQVVSDDRRIVKRLKGVWNQIFDALLGLKSLVGRRDVDFDYEDEDEDVQI